MNLPEYCENFEKIRFAKMQNKIKKKNIIGRDSSEIEKSDENSSVLMIPFALTNPSLLPFLAV